MEDELIMNNGESRMTKFIRCIDDLEYSKKVLNFNDVQSDIELVLYVWDRIFGTHHFDAAREDKSKYTFETVLELIQSSLELKNTYSACDGDIVIDTKNQNIVLRINGLGYTYIPELNETGYVSGFSGLDMRTASVSDECVYEVRDLTKGAFYIDKLEE